MKPDSPANFVVKAILGLAVCCGALFSSPSASAAGPVVVGLWRFNEGSGTNISDSSGLGNNGYLAGDNGKLPTWTSGQAGFGSALMFTNDNTNHNYVAIPGSPTLMIGQTPTNAWSITAWAYENSEGTGDFYSTYGRILVIDDGTAQQVESGAAGGDDEFYTWARTTGAWQIPWVANGLAAPLLDQWEHIAVTYDGTNETFYLDGNEGVNGSEASQAVSAALNYIGYQGSVLIGSELDQLPNHNWNGMLDDVAEFNGALTEAQVQTVMSGNFAPFIGGAPGFVTQPVSVVTGAGSNVTFTAGAYGSATLHYQWYFNGTSLGPTATSSSLTVNDVGAAQAGTYSLIVSNTQGTATTAATLSLNPSLVGLWRFDEGSGTNVIDSSGLGNNGYLAGDNGNLPSWTAGQSGYGDALAFNNDGANHTYVTIPASPSLQIGQFSSNAWTLTAWAYENSDGTGDFVSSYGRIAVIDDGFAFQLESGASGDGELYTWSENNPAWQIPWGVGSPVTPLLDQWEHWAIVYDGTNFIVYLNGDEAGGIASDLITSSLGSVGYQGSIVIGSELDQNPSCNWNGMLDDVAVFAGALNQSQVQTVMSGDFSGFMGGPPAIVSEPLGGTVMPGTTATLSVGANGSPTLDYQWYHNGTSLGVAGHSATLTIPNINSSQAGTYWAVVSNAMGSATSDPAVLSVGNLVALWRFNEGSGTTAFDASGNGNNGTLVGPTWATGKYGNALSFANDGTDYSYVSVPGNPLLEIGQTATNGWSITAWAYESSGGTGDFVATYGRILVIDGGLDLQLESGASGDGEFYTWDNLTGSWEIGWGTGDSVSPLLDQWVHWTVTYDGNNTLTLYRDGGTGPNGGVATSSVTQYLEYGCLDQGAVTIGSELDQPANRNWNGLLDDIAIFNVALTPSQIQSVMAGNFNGFVPRPPLTISLSGGNTLVSWPVSAQTFKLQSATSVTGTWSAVVTQPVQSGNTLTVTLANAAHPVYFRLVGP